MMMQGGNNTNNTTTGSSPALVGMIGQNPHLGASGSLHSGSSHHSVAGGRQRGGSQQYHQGIPQMSTTPVHLMGSSSQINTTPTGVSGIPDPNVMSNIINASNNDGGKETQSSFGSQQHDFMPFTGLSISGSHPPLSNSDPPFQPQNQPTHHHHQQQQYQPQQQQQHQQPQYQQYQGHFQPSPAPYTPTPHPYQGGGFMAPPPGSMYQHHHHMQQFMAPQMMQHHHMAPPPPWQVASSKAPPVVAPGGGGGRNQGKIWQEQLAEAVRDKGIMCKDFYTTSRCTLQCCPYAHIKEGQTSVIPDMACNFHLQGRCLRDNCRYFHGSKEQLRTLHRRRAAGGSVTDTPPPNAAVVGGAKGAVSTYNPSEFLPIRASPVELGLDVIERVLASQGSLPPVAQVAASLLLEQGQVRAAATAGRPQDYFDVPSTNRLLQPATAPQAPSTANNQQFSYMSPVNATPEINVYSDGTGGTYQLTHHPAHSHPPTQQTPNTFNPPHPQYYYAVMDGNTTVQPAQQPHQWAPQQQQTQQVQVQQHQSHQPSSNIMFTPAPLSSNSHNGNSTIFSNPSTTTATSIHSPSQLAASNNQLAGSGQSHPATSSSSSNRPSHSLPIHQVANHHMSSNKGDMSNRAQHSSQGMGAIESESYHTSAFGFNNLLSNGSNNGGGVGGGAGSNSLQQQQKDTATMIRATSDAFDDCNPTPPQGQRQRAANHLMGSFSSSGQAVAGSDSTVHVGGGRPPQYPPNQTGNSNTSDMMYSSPPKGGTPHHQFLAPGSSMQTASSTSISSQQHARNNNTIGDPLPPVVPTSTNSPTVTNTPQQQE